MKLCFIRSNIFDLQKLECYLNKVNVIVRVKEKNEDYRGGGLLTQKAFVPQNFDSGTLLLRDMGWLLTQGPLTHRILTQGGF